MKRREFLIASRGQGQRGGPEDPDPHGMCMHEGKLYYSDAGIAPGGKPSGSSSAGYICRIDM